tara:strand:+ start:617 stop:1186 length:570 start_codon:yes stop_codon:yes gene_type:complete
MKKFFITALTALSFYLSVNAQDNKFGLKIGLNFAELNDLEGVIKTGLLFGATYNYSLNESFSLQPELVYSSQGVEDVIYDGKKISLNYLNLPLMAQYKLSFIKGASLELGPQIGYLLSSKNGGEAFINKLNKVDFSIGIGGTYEINEELSLSIRGIVGVTDTDIVDKHVPEANMTNKLIQLTVGYKLPL